jgi:hypothetical protein
MAPLGALAIYNYGPIWGMLIYYFCKFFIMGKKSAVEFVANVQSKDKKNHRKIIELPVHIRDNFAPGDTLKVWVEKI